MEVACYVRPDVYEALSTIRLGLVGYLGTLVLRY